MNKVQYLLKTNIINIEDRCKIKHDGRPTPEVKIKQDYIVKGKNHCRSFNNNIYQRNSWICGCEVSDRLYCFPCLIFAKGCDSAWTKTGINDLVHLSQKIKKHEESSHHKNACIDFSMLGKTEIRQQLSDAFRQNIERHNDLVRKNRYILSKIIDCIKFCGEFELALRGHDETVDSSNPGIFRGLINFSAALDSALNEHFKSTTIFKGTSKEIQNDLLDCMLQVCRQNILSEISHTDYIALIADETTDVSSKYQLVVILRYILKNGHVVERFWTFINPVGCNAISITDCIKNVLNDVIGQQKNKLISQSYDGASVMSGQRGGVQALIREEYPHAHFIHCYAHQLNLVISSAASQNREVRIFFANLSEIVNFFSHSPQRTQVLSDIVGRRLPSGSSTRWNFQSRTVLTVHEHKESLIECFEKIEETSMQNNTINQAQGLKLKLQQAGFNFWLEFFYKVMPHVDILYNILQRRNLNPLTAMSATEDFTNEMRKIRENVDLIASEISENFPHTSKRIREDHQITRVAAAKEICDLIVNSCTERFKFNGHLMIASLFNSENFPDFDKNFPNQILDDVLKSFDSIFDRSKLKTELQVLYGREDFKNVKKVTDLLSCLIDNNLEECFGEVIKALKILNTIPMTTSEAERCFSSLKRIKTFLRSTMEEERLTALAMLSIEKKMVHQLVDFNEKVIDIFVAKKERRLDFVYKNFVSSTEA